MPAEIIEPFREQVRLVFKAALSIREQLFCPTLFGTRRYKYLLDPILDDGQEVTAVVALVRDITEDDAEG